MKINTPYLIAIILALVFNGILVFFTLENTYDALIHLFFGSHYAESWFNAWEPRWYTGFSVMSYPPLVHQLLGLFSFVFGYKLSLFIVATIISVIFVTGVYRFSLLLLENKRVAGYAAIFGAFSTVFLETLHIFGQLPTLMGIGLLLHSFPYAFRYLSTGKWRHLLEAFTIIAMGICSHHVTTIFGLVFFIAPLFGYFVMQKSYLKKKALVPSITHQQVRIGDFITTFIENIFRMFVFGFGVLLLIVFCILPYWILSKQDPISQVPIPHGSRDNFMEITSSGLIFFVVPWGLVLFVLPYIFYRLLSKKYIFFGISFALMFLLGTGGTTPLPRLMLGENAFNILTLDRFTFWAAILAIPFMGEFIFRWLEGDLKERFIKKGKMIGYYIGTSMLTVGMITSVVAIFLLGVYRPFQPEKINMNPLVNFLNQDMHYRWRYLTLGFGDQMAWLSTLTNAQTVDGNYHSARRLPELTTRAVERLESAKYQQMEGLGSLQQILSNAEKYHLKYIFSNDKFYDPLLYFYGWNRLTPLENGVVVWEKSGVKQMPYLQSRKLAHPVLNILWGIIPLLTVFLVILVHFILKIKPKKDKEILVKENDDIYAFKMPRYMAAISVAWVVLISAAYLFTFYHFYIKNQKHHSAENVMFAYYNALDFKNFEEAYECVLPNPDFSMDQFMLENSVQDGILNSYGKMDNIKIKTIKEDEHQAYLEVELDWVTPLKKLHQKTRWHVKKQDGKWYIVREKNKPYIPQELVMESSLNKYYNPGRRKAIANQNDPADELHLPQVWASQARLIKNDSTYHVVGEIINADDFPTAVHLTAELYDNNNEMLASYQAEDVMKHFLLPKSATSFRIDFRPIAWKNKEDKTSFNPDQVKQAVFEKEPVKFVLHISTSFYLSESYNRTIIMDFNPIDVSAYYYNYGVQEVTIPQVIQTLYNAEKQIVWVDAQYLDEAIKPRKRSYFELNKPPKSNILFIYDGLMDVYINGNQNQPDKLTENPDVLVPKNEGYIKLEMNNFIGNYN